MNRPIGAGSEFRALWLVAANALATTAAAQPVVAATQRMGVAGIDDRSVPQKARGAARVALQDGIKKAGWTPIEVSGASEDCASRAAECLADLAGSEAVEALLTVGPAAGDGATWVMWWYRVVDGQLFGPTKIPIVKGRRRKMARDITAATQAAITRAPPARADAGADNAANAEPAPGGSNDDGDSQNSVSPAPGATDTNTVAPDSKLQRALAAAVQALQDATSNAVVSRQQQPTTGVLDVPGAIDLSLTNAIGGGLGIEPTGSGLGAFLGYRVWLARFTGLGVRASFTTRIAQDTVDTTPGGKPTDEVRLALGQRYNADLLLTSFWNVLRAREQVFFIAASGGPVFERPARRKLEIGYKAGGGVGVEWAIDRLGLLFRGDVFVTGFTDPTLGTTVAPAFTLAFYYYADRKD